MFLLDTCTLIWLVADAPLAAEAHRLMDRAAVKGELYVSPVSAWEIGTLVRRKRLELNEPAEMWIDHVFSRADVQVAALTPQIAARSCFLPGEFHNDPADRLILATAVILGLRLITRDAHMLKYGREGYASVMAC
jgi:PIN domain nuclease of toxin-antitoxin system